MAQLTGFPMVSQRDGDTNQDYDCVAASIAASLTWLTGKAYTAREVKDTVYGAGYTGGTDASAYVNYCAEQGVKLAPVNGSGAQLVAALRASIGAQHPALITEPDPYAQGWSHVCAAYKCDSTSITVMDPWIAAPVVKSDAGWESTLLGNQIWTLERTMLTIDQASTYFEEVDASHWKVKKTGVVLQDGNLAWYCQMRSGATPDLGGLTLLGLPTSNEKSIDAAGNTEQEFERGWVRYDPKHTYNSPPGAGASYNAHVDTVISSLQGQVAALQAASVTTQNTTTASVSDLTAQLHAIETADAAALKDLGTTGG